MPNYHKHWYGTLAQYNALASKDSNTLYHCSEGLIYRGSVLLATRRWGDLSGVPSTFAPSAHTLGSHSDVTLTSPANGNILKYNGSKWVNNTLAQAGIATPTDISTAIDNIEIGGRNLALDSVVPNFKSTSVRKRTKLVRDEINKLAGKEVTVSFEAKTGESKLQFYVYCNLTSLYGTPTHTVDSKGADWQKYKFTTTLSIDVSDLSEPNLTFRANPINSTNFDVRNVKLEKGTKATDWSPAPEDVQAEIDLKAPLANPIFTGKVGIGADGGNNGVVFYNGTGVTGRIYRNGDTLYFNRGGDTSKGFELSAAGVLTHRNNFTVTGSASFQSVSATSFTGPLTGNASSATILQTTRKINGVDFNGSANITVTANTTYTLTRGSYLTGSNFNGSANTTWAVDATSANTAGKVVARDSNGDFACRVVNAVSGVYSLKVVTGGHNYASQTYGVGIGTDGSNSGVIFYDGTGATGRIYRDSDVMRFIRGGLSYSGFDINADGSVTVQGDMTTRTSLVVGSTNGTYVQIGSARLVYDQTNNAIKVVNADNSSCSLYATGSISAFGIGSSGGSGTSYSRLDDWADYVDGLTNDYLLSAELGYDLHTRVNSLNSFRSGTSWGNSGTGVANLSIGGTAKVVSLSGHSHTFSAITNKPTTLGGYGITNAMPLTGGTFYNSVFQILEIKRNGVNGASMMFSNNNQVLAKFGFDAAGSLIMATGDSNDGVPNMLYVNSGTKQMTGYGSLNVSGNIETGTSDGAYVRIGNSRFLYDSSTSGLMLLNVSGGYGALRAGSVFANNVELTSSRSMKKDIIPFKNGLDLIKSIDVVSYLYKQDSDDDDRKIGFIADDTDSWLSGKSKTKYNIGNTVGALIKAVQELEKKNQELEQRLLSITNNN